MKKLKTVSKKVNNHLKKSFNKIKRKIKPDDYNSFSIPEVIMLVIVSILFGVIVGCILTYSALD